MTRVLVRDLVSRGFLRVEDGNHGNDRPRPTEFVSDGVAFIRAADMTSGVVDFERAGKIDEVARRRIRKGVGAPGDVILSHKGTVGRVAVAPLDAPAFVCSPQTTFWRSLNHEILDQKYLKYVLMSGDFRRQLAILSGQTDMAPYVSLTDQRALEFNLVGVGEQRAIAEVLGALDDKIAANEQVVNAATSLAVTLAGTASGVAVVSDLVRHATTQLSPGRFDELVAHYSLPAFDAGNRPEGSARASIKSNKFLLERPVVLVSKLNPRIPRVWDVAVLPERMAVASTEFVVLELLGTSTTALWAALSQPSVVTELSGKVAGTSGSHQRVRPAEVLALHVPDPRALDPRMLNEIDAIGQSVHHLRNQNERLAATRDQLLPLLMSGRLHVKHAERTVEEVV